MPKILLVDDDESSRTTLSALLEDDGFSVRCTASMGGANEYLAGNANADLVLLDQNLGDGLGSDLLPSIRARLPGVRVLLMSGRNLHGAFADLADATFEKGGPYEELRKRIDGLLAFAERSS